MADELTYHPIAPAAERALQHVEEVNAALLAVLRQHWPIVGYHLIAHALVETAGAVLVAIAEADPSARPDLDAKLADLRLFVGTAGQRPQ
jgi:hypothetical protein